jgi:hypothetical protein
VFFKKPFDYEKMLLKYIDEDFSLFACGEDAPQRNDLNKFEKRYKIKLPNDFKDYSLSPLGGLSIEVKEDIWPRPKQLEVGPFWSFLYGLEVFGFAADIPEWMDIDIQTNVFTNQTHNDYIPFMKVIGDADIYIVLIKKGEFIDGIMNLTSLIKLISRLLNCWNMKLRN